MVEAAGVSQHYFQQLVVDPTDSDSTHCLCGLQEDSKLTLPFLQSP
jgi:hypothetical protein